MKTVTVAVKGDTKVEPNEFFSLVLTGTTQAFTADSTGYGTILNDDGGGGSGASASSGGASSNDFASLRAMTRSGPASRN